MQVEKFLEEIRQSSLVVMDGNIPVETMDYVLRICKASRIPGRERLAFTCQTSVAIAFSCSGI
jgi:hypothetical protein